MEDEIWKDIKGYEGLYQISNFGRIKSLCRKFRNKDIILKPLIGKGNYLQINLYKNGKMLKYQIHRLVAETFIINSDNLPCINHKDENRQNNCVKNLEWCTYQYNNSYGNRLEKVSYNNKFSKRIIQYSKNDEFIKEWNNARTAIIENNFFKKNNTKLITIKRAILNCCERQRKTAYGFKWEYK